MALHRHGSPIIGGFRLVDNIVDKQLHPRRSQHVVDEVVLSVAPVPRKFLQLESDYIVVRVKHCVHVSMEPLESVNSLHVEFNFNLVVRICSNHEVDIIPIR